jgi:hypothetical protein
VDIKSEGQKMINEGHKLVFERQRGKMKAFETLVKDIRGRHLLRPETGGQPGGCLRSLLRGFFYSLLAEDVIIPGLFPEDESLVDNDINKEPTKSNQQLWEASNGIDGII